MSEGKLKTPGEKLAENPRSMRAAINAMCWQCMGGDGADPGWRNMIRNCTSPKCALWNFRPYRDKADHGKVDGCAGKAPRADTHGEISPSNVSQHA